MKGLLEKELEEVEEILFLIEAVLGGIKERRGVYENPDFDRNDRSDPIFWIDFAHTALSRVKDFREKGD